MDDSVNIPSIPPHAGQTGSGRKRPFYEHVARFCDKCGRPYSEKDVDILQQDEYSVVIHFNCPNCKARHLATFIKPLGITSRILVNTDLTIEELPKFAGKSEIKPDDLLDVHEALNTPSFSIDDLF